MAAGPPSQGSGPVGAAWGRWTEEVRLAMAWNGGVSLAVWMGGIAVELDAARRARPQVSADEAKLPPPPVTRTARSTADLYSALLLAFDRCLVIDILAGASAGGLNSALLAGAITHEEELKTTFLREKWLAIGDFGTLLQPLENKSPSSVMQGERFFEQLRLAFGELLGTGPPTGAGLAGREVPVLLDIQATDVQGAQHCFVDEWGQPFYAREYRSPVRFRELRDFTPGTLAAAARASASFPGAFEPQKLNGNAARLAGFPDKTRWAIDGGLLENAPIRPAIELIPRRRSAGPVKRFVCYVDAAPTAFAEPDLDPAQPSLAKVLGYTVNLPRDGRVIDQLTALEDATRRSGITADTGVRLLGLEPTALVATASTLLSTYQRRRALLSLEELLSDNENDSGPARARSVLGKLDADADADSAAAGAGAIAMQDAPSRGAARLPWIPDSVSPPTEPADWRWGVRVAQRILQLELDLLRAVLLVTESEGDADEIFAARAQIDWRLAALDGVYSDFVNGSAVQLARDLDSERRELRDRGLLKLRNETRGYGQTIYEYLRPATANLYRALTRLSEEARAAAGLPPLESLFGDSQRPGGLDGDPPAPTGEPTLSDAAYGMFLQRAFAVEVIRRSFSDDFDIEAAQTLHVAQLTPLIPAPLFSMGNPDGPRARVKSRKAETGTPPDRNDGEAAPGEPMGPGSVKDKLAGVRLNHFGGFYRRSWRANDFMWGRLDGAAAIARLLVDGERAKALASRQAAELAPWRQLARALVPDPGDEAGDDDRTALLWELLREPGDEASPPPPAELKTRLEAALKQDLMEQDGTRTHAFCARALQYEVLREENRELVVQAQADKENGAFLTALGWTASTPLPRVIASLRGARGEHSLPARLGCDSPDETTSTLALRTLAHVFLVALSALAGVAPLTRSLQPVRVPLLAVEGSTARRPLDRLAVVLGFAGAAWYLAARWLSDTSGDVPLRAVWSPQVLALWVSMVAVIGVSAVPILRAAKTRSFRRRLWQGGTAAAILATGGGVALVWTWFERGTVEALTAWNATYSPSNTLLWIVVAGAGFHVASSLDSILRYASRLLHSFRSWVSYTSIVLGGIGAALAVATGKNEVAPALDDGGWKTVVAVLAFAAPLILAGYLGFWADIRSGVRAVKRRRR